MKEKTEGGTWSYYYPRHELLCTKIAVTGKVYDGVLKCVRISALIGIAFIFASHVINEPCGGFVWTFGVSTIAIVIAAIPFLCFLDKQYENSKNDAAAQFTKMREGRRRNSM